MHSERYIVCNAAQGTRQWFLDRLGRVTSSNAHRALARGNGMEEAVSRSGYRMELVLERITGRPTPLGFLETEAMTWGKQQEPFSRMAYEVARGIDIAQAGFVYLRDIAAGASVDGFLVERGRRGIWESKSPKSKNHYAWLMAGKVPAEHMPQIVHELWVTGADFCDFQSYDPRMPKGLTTFIRRVEREEIADRLEAHERAILQFLLEVEAEEHRMRQLAA
ncbi:exonuclease [Paracidovorax avenae]|uniref:lambda exonuclease family protein n=1 Tax=Paracidovorax avenae TaxID=80867 RepID=UPI000D220D67|nr:lambda exonuclease family protein [Paracidovorax avenae]AVS68157.1 exonuclease [Paracidovorax avenae]